MKNLRGGVAVVTGAGSGIGRALAQQLASRGAQLALADKNESTLEETCKLLGAAQLRTYAVDVSDAAAVEGFARKVERDFGRASLLINNAGVALCGTFDQLTLADFDWLFRINFWGVVYGCKFFLPLLQREPEAHIVNISSVFGLIGPPGQTAYAASKFAVRGFTQALGRELADSKIAVTCVHPGGIRTRIAENARAAAATPVEDQMQARARFDQLARTPPEKAAQVIVSGILRNKARVLIGADAYRIDFFQRLLPVRSVAALAKILGSKPPKTALAAAAKEETQALSDRL
jgi:NAD(P)-dependent dehydrogenase (short-subunit alcohol dehydrogenase family)